MSDLIPGAAIIYENVDGVIYGRYRDHPHTSTPRWIVGGNPTKVAIAQGKLLAYSDWQDLHTLSEKHTELKKQLKKLITLYYLYKEEK